MDDASPDGTQEVARELARVWGEDRIVSTRSGNKSARHMWTSRDRSLAGHVVGERTLDYVPLDLWPIIAESRSVETLFNEHVCANADTASSFLALHSSPPAYLT